MERLYLGITVTSTYALVTMALILAFIRLGRLSWRPSAFSACGVCAIARQPVGRDRVPVACRARIL